MTKEIELKAKIALANLKKLKVHPDCWKAFKQDASDVWCSEFRPIGNGGFGCLYYIRDGYTYEKEAQEAIRRVREDGYFPYHVVQRHMEFGNLFVVLFISNEIEADDLENADYDPDYGYRVCCYAYNSMYPDMSEYDMGCVKGAGGGVILTT